MVWFIWILFTVAFYLIAFWTFLESVRKKLSIQQALYVLKQGLFVTGCTALSIAIDVFLFPAIDRMYFDGSPGYDVARFLILPFILVLAAVVIGPTSPIRISKAPTLNRKNTDRA